MGKIALLAVVVAAVLVWHMAYQASAPAGGLAEIVTARGSSTAAAMPRFILPAASVSAADGSNTSGTADASATGSRYLKTPPPALNIEGSIVADLGTGQVYESLNPGVRWPTASLTKLMTATLVMDDIPSSTTITITEPMLAVDPQDEHTLVLGGTYNVPDLLHVMLMPSSNVAAQAFADFYGEEQFMAAMNARAAAWGMADTYFDDPSGLSAANESTPDDFMKLAEQVYAHYPEILRFTNTPSLYITELQSGRKVFVKSINLFAGEPDFIGGKTGYTDQADGNLLSVFNHNGHPVLVVVLGSNDRFKDTETLYDWFKANF